MKLLKKILPCIGLFLWTSLNAAEPEARTSFNDDFTDAVASAKNLKLSWGKPENFVINPDHTATLKCELKNAASILLQPCKGWNNYEIELEMITAGTTGHAGIRVRSSQTLKKSAYIFMDANQKIMGINGVLAKDISEPIREKSEWYAVKIICQGKKLEVYLNGQLFFKEEFSWEEGDIFLYCWQSQITYRNLKVTRL